MDVNVLLISAAPWVGSVLGLLFSVVAIGGLAVLFHQAGLFYTLPKWAIHFLGARLATR